MNKNNYDLILHNKSSIRKQKQSRFKRSSMLSVKDAAKHLGVSYKMMITIADEEGLVSVVKGNTIYYSSDELYALQSISDLQIAAAF